MTTHPQAIVLITGIQASGKSTVAQALAERLPRSVHLRGDAFRRMVVNGRADMTAPPTEEAVSQLRLRHRLTAQAADAYFEAGFTVVAQDVILGDHLRPTVAAIRSRPLLLVVLAPSPTSIASREASRQKTAYAAARQTTGGAPAAGAWTIEALDAVLRTETPRLGLWLDTADQTPAQTVDEILHRAWNEAAV